MEIKQVVKDQFTTVKSAVMEKGHLHLRDKLSPSIYGVHVRASHVLLFD